MGFLSRTILKDFVIWIFECVNMIFFVYELMLFFTNEMLLKAVVGLVEDDVW